MATVRPESIPKQLPLGSVATSKSLRYDVLASSWTRDRRALWFLAPGGGL